MQPLAGFTSDTPDDSASLATKPLLGVCPVAMMTISVVSLSPLVSSIWTLSPFSGIPPEGIFTLLPVISLEEDRQQSVLHYNIEKQRLHILDTGILE